MTSRNDARDISQSPTCDDHILVIFVNEIEHQCDFALLAADGVNAGLSSGDSTRLWYSVQSLLVAAGNLSKLLWPNYRTTSEKKFSDRGERLRELLAVDDSSALKPRTFRNHFEHFDVRLEDWAATVAGRPFVDWNVNAHLLLKGVPREHYLRNIDTKAGTITYRGSEYRMQEIIDAVQAIKARARQVSADLDARRRQADVSAPNQPPDAGG